MDMTLWAAALGVAMVAGMVKGLVGFAMPMVMISGLSLFFPADVALAGLICATLVSNIAQALRQGVGPAWASILRFRRFVLLVMGFILVSAQLVPLVPGDLLLGIIGLAVTCFGLVQLFGWRLRVTSGPGGRMEWMMGVAAGFIGGVSGIWGPPTVAYLLSLDLPKAEFMRVQGVVYGLGAVMLAVAHLGSGVLNAQTLPFSASLVPAALVGLWIGFRLQDRLDRDKFLTATLLVLIVAGLNLMRRAVF